MFPYEEHKDTELWNKIEKILLELEENQDISITTAREYVIGYFCKQFSEPDTE